MMPAPMTLIAPFVGRGRGEEERKRGFRGAEVLPELVAVLVGAPECGTWDPWVLQEGRKGG